MRHGGRPLRFLVLVFGAWIGLRSWQLWPDPPVPKLIRHAMRRIGARRDPLGPMIMSRPPSTIIVAASTGPTEKTTAPAYQMPAIVDPPMVALATPDPPAIQQEASPSYLVGLLDMVRYGTPLPATPSARHWSASGWAMLRGSSAGSGVATPQLGGSQAGIRIARTLDRQGRLAIATRVAMALDTRQQEAAVGLDWRPTALPVRIVAERRIGLANQRGGTAVGLVGGVSDRPLPGGFRLDGYAQAGTVIRAEPEGYADGAMHVTRRVTGSGGGATIALGFGVWGGAQRDALRLDIGPAATLDAPIGHASHLRFAVEWRQRVAGDARPSSGPALSIGTDY